MAKLLISVFLLLVSIIMVYPQDKEKIIWEELSSDWEEFTVMFPMNNYRNESRRTKNTKEFVGRYRAYANQTYFFIFSDQRGELEQGIFRSFLNFAKKNEISEENIQIKGFKGRKLTFRDDEGFFHEAVFIKTNKRFYIFQALSREKNSRDVKTFISSIKLNTQISQNKSIKKSLFDEYLKQELSVPSKFPVQPSGINSEINEDEKEEFLTKDYGDQDLPLKFLVRPRVGYSNLARIYDIQGVVLIRATFHASGRVTNVSVEIALPFGLTKKTIQAAKSIRFRPKVVNGKPISVTKRIQYRFTIY